MKHIRLIALLLSSLLLLGACSPAKRPSEQNPSDEQNPSHEQDSPAGEDLTLYPAALPRDEGELITWYSADLKETMRLAAEYVEGMLDADKDYELYFCRWLRHSCLGFARAGDRYSSRDRTRDRLSV